MQVIYTLTQAMKDENNTVPLVVDIGSGQGHLSRKLSLYHGLRVLNLEVDETHVRKASRFDKWVLLVSINFSTTSMSFIHFDGLC